MSSTNAPQPQGLSEISEKTATGSVAALYADIRTVLDVDLVNLIYRHLATIPGALEWAWANLAPHFRSGEIDSQAALLRESIKAHFPSWPQRFSFSDCNPSDLISAARLTQVYNLNNSRNLLAFRHLLDETVGLTVSAEVTIPSGTPAGIQGAPPLPAIASWEEISAPDRETVLRINRIGESQEPSIVASLYRHLVLWPSLLNNVETALTRIDAAGEIRRALTFTVDTSQAIAQQHPLRMPVPAPDAVDATVRARLRTFIDVTIPKMVPVGLALESALTTRSSSLQRETPCT